MSAVTLSAILMLQFGSGSDCILAQDSGQARLETVATFDGPMPTGVTVSGKGRIFVNFPRWGDDVEFTVAELVDGKAEPFPSAEFNQLNKSKPADGVGSKKSAESKVAA